MAFMGIAIMWLFVIFGILGFLFFVSAVCFIISAMIKRKYNQRVAEGSFEKRPISITVLNIIGFVFLLPAIAAVLLIISAVAGAVIKNGQ